MDAAAVAEMNTGYASTGINSPTARQIEQAFRAHFSEFHFVEDAFIEATCAVSRASKLAAPLLALPGAQAAYRGLHTRVVLARNG